jgi:hypothetical protein
MAKINIKVGHQEQAAKPIYLLPNGAIQCGIFLYEGRYKKKFKAIYERILSLAPCKPRGGVIDVSQHHYWDAIRIYHEYVVVKWVKSVSAKQIERFANETEVFIMLEDIRTEFKRAVGLKWQKEFKKASPNDPNRPRQAWQIL